jgi:ribose-phosphate pyrophosphokinase
MKIVSCNSNRALAKAVASHLNEPLVECTIKKFPDSEISVEIHENIRGEDVFVLQSTSSPVNDHLMELLVCLDALKRSSARRVTAVIPYFGYARQDRKSGPRTPISAKLVANLLTEAGANRVLTIDLHAGQIQGFFDIPVDNLTASPIFAKDIMANYTQQNVIIVSPDVGGVVRARNLASRINSDLAIIDKRRPCAGVSEVMNVIGDVRDRDCILFDDIVDSGGTLINACNALINNHAKSVSVYVTHGVLSGLAALRIQESALMHVAITNTIQPTSLVNSSSKIAVLDMSMLLAHAINRIHNEQSVSSLFD